MRFGTAPLPMAPGASDLKGGSSNLTWGLLSALASKPIMVDRQTPKPCRGLFEQVTLLFATTITMGVRQAIATVEVPVNSVSYIDDTVLLRSPDDVASVLQELPTLLEPTGLQLQPSKTKVWGSPTPGVVATHPQLKGLQATVSDTCNRPLTAYVETHESSATCRACVATSRQVYRWHGPFRGRCRAGSSTSSERIAGMACDQTQAGLLETSPPPSRGANTGRFGNFGFFPCFTGVFGPVNGIDLIKTL